MDASAQVEALEACDDGLRSSREMDVGRHMMSQFYFAGDACE